MEISSFLPNEIMVEILLRLPAMSIGRCRCVSKQWRSVLSQTHFIKKHLDRMRKLQQKSVILDSQSGSFYSITLSNTHQVLNEVTQPATKLNFTGYRDSWIWFIASCDGLFLVRGNSNFLLNPVTGEIREVVPLPFTRDPYNSYTSYGFGYDSVNDDYKIVILSYYNRCLKYGIEDPDMFVNVYSVKNCSWKKVESSPYDCAVGHFSSGVFVNGCIHWLAIHSSVILAFDLAKEKFHEVSTPNSIGESVLHYFVELRGCLCLFSKSYYDGTDVWIMKEYGNKDSWTMFTIIDPEMAQFGPISMLDQQHIVLVKDKGTSDEKCVKYDLEKRTFKVIITHAIWDQFYYKGVFMESLVSPYSAHGTS